LRGVTPSRRLAVSRALVWTAGLAGVVHAAFSLYWALGGRWLLATVGQWAVDLSTEAPLAAGIALGLVATAKLLGAAIPIGVAYGRVPWPRFWRGISWAGGLLLVAYGGVNTIVAVAVLAGVFRAEPASADRDGAAWLLTALTARLSTVRLVWADGGYSGRLLPWADRVLH